MTKASANDRGASASEWISQREPRPPDALMARMNRALDGAAFDGAIALESKLIAAALSILDGTSTSDDVVAGRTVGGVREAALDLLAADALVTYAMEAAAGNCESMSATADSVMKLLAKS